MLTRPGRYVDALAYPHAAYARVDVHTGAGVLLESDLPFWDGSVGAVLTSRVARRLSLKMTESFYPTLTTDLMAPFGNEIRAYRGITYGDGGHDEFPVFRGRIDSVSIGSVGEVQVECLDRAGDVVGADFEVPHVATAGPVVDEYRRLVLEVLPDATFDPEMGNLIFERTAALMWEADRAQAIEDLATSAGAFWYPLADGTFTMRKVPWASAGTPQFVLADGPGGMVVRSQLSRSRQDVHNSVTVLVERTDPDAFPMFYTARDTDETSPTYILGNFGLRARQVSVQAATTQAQARTAAETLLRRGRAITETLGLEIKPDASIELGDVFTANVRGRTLQQVVAAFTLPLGAQGTMAVECRQHTPGVQLG